MLGRAEEIMKYTRSSRGNLVFASCPRIDWGSESLLVGTGRSLERAVHDTMPAFLGKY